ncbi:MAG: hypothetical protein NVS2B7_28740 [Herpetosiphon sp.]
MHPREMMMRGLRFGGPWAARRRSMHGGPGGHGEDRHGARGFWHGGRPGGEHRGGGPGGPGGFGGSGGHGGHGGPGGPGDRWWGRRGGPKVGRGDVRAALLTLLAEHPQHGYELIQQITARSGGVWRPSPGSVYPALQLLEDQGLIVSEPDEGRRVFHLTEAGRAYVEQHQSELAAAWSAVTNNIDDAVMELRDLLEQVAVATRQTAQAGTVSQVAQARTLLVTTRRQLYRILADDLSGGEAESADPKAT